MPLKTRKFDGKVYTFSQSWRFKDRAKIEADRLRDKGISVRIVPSVTLFIEKAGDRPKPRWNIYTRQKQSLSPRKSGGSAVHVRAHARKGTKGVRAHTRKQ